MPLFKRQPQQPVDEYRRIILDSRKRQLRLTATAVQRLQGVFDAAVRSIETRMAEAVGERATAVWQRAQLQLLVDIRTIMDGLKKDYGNLLDLGRIELAQNAAEREAALAKLVDAPSDPTLFPNLERTLTLTSGVEIPVQFGRVALTAVERTAERYFSDGLRLADRLYNLDARTRKVIEDTLIQGIAEGIGAREMADRVRLNLTEVGVSGRPAPRHMAMRIARTEINNAHREAHILSTQTAPGVLKEYISGVRWNLSLSHPAPDICDVWAAHDGGLGPGIYLPGDAPSDHPNGLCFTTTVLKAIPASGVGGAKPDVSAVPESQVAYYAERGDGPARALAQGMVA